MSISKFLVLFLILSIISIYYAGLKLDKLDNKKEELIKEKDSEIVKEIKDKYKKYKKRVILICILFNLSFLFYFKYLNFFKINTNLLFDLFNIKFQFKIFKYLAPIGISYYTLQAIGYLIDIYNGKIKADKNILRLSLFMSFFPQIMEGPISKYHETADSLYESEKIKYKNLCFGYKRILYGFFKKYVIADRINIFVSLVFANYLKYSGFSVLLGVIGYTILLYMEFSGTMDIVIGLGEIFGIKIPENFRQPFFAKNVSEFWQRWHISLGRFFKDYVYYPVSLSKPLKKLTMSARKKLGNRFGPLISGAIALFAVWSLNGLWHGAGWTFIFFGMYHFIMILFGNIFEPTVINICKKLNINRNNLFYRVMQSVKMTIFIFIGEIFFRAKTVGDGFMMIRQILTNFYIDKKELLKLGMDIQDYVIVIIAIIFVFVISLLKEKEFSIRDKIAKQNIFVRWTIYYALIIAIIVFGAYGLGYLPVEPIYADF